MRERDTRELQLKTRLTREGVHLFARETGLNILFDEIQVSSSRWAKAPRYVSIALTNSCDLACPFCYAPKNALRLDEHDVLGWLIEMDTGGCLGVGFGGGEPTLLPGFAELCRRARARTRLAITFTTHAHRLTPRMAAELRGNIHFIRVSIDGVDETYERIRGRPFARLRKQLSLVRSISPFGINTVVNAETVSSLDAVVDVALEEGAAELLLLPEQAGLRADGIDSETLRKLESWVASRPRRIRLAISEVGATARMSLADPFEAELPLEAHAHIDAAGVLKANAYAQGGVPITDFVMDALEELREMEHAG